MEQPESVVDVAVVFPGLLRQRSVPDVITKILLHVNYTDDLHSLRLVSRGWRDFIDREMLDKPNMKKTILMEKEFAHVWTRRPLRKKLEVVASGRIRLKATVLGDCIIITERAGVNLRRDLIYRNHKYFGFILYGTNLPSLAPCREFFVDRNDFHYPSTLKFKVYSKRGGAPWDMELRPRPLDTTISLLGRRILMFKRIDDDHMILLSVDEASGNLIISNLVDDSEKTIPVSRIGIGLVDFAMDRRQMAIMWGLDVRMLQMIDLVKAEELWVQRYEFLEGAGFALCKAARLTCILVLFLSANMPDSTLLQIYDNRSGQLINCFSTKAGVNFDSLASFGRHGFVWSTWSRQGTAAPCIRRLYALDVKRGSLSEISMKGCVKTNECYISSATFYGTVRGRILLAWFACKCGPNLSLVAYDLIEASPAEITLDSCHCPYYWEGISRGIFLNFNRALPNNFYILDFTQKLNMVESISPLPLNYLNIIWSGISRTLKQLWNHVLTYLQCS